MEPLFRLALVRPAVSGVAGETAIELAQQTPFQAALIEASRTARPRESMRRIAARFVSGSVFLSNSASTPFAIEIERLSEHLDERIRSGLAKRENVVEAIEQAFGVDPSTLAGREAFHDARVRLRDSILAIKQSQEEHARPIEALANQLRLLEVVARVATDSKFPRDAGELRAYRRRGLLLPLKSRLASNLSTRELNETLRKQAAEKRNERQRHADALLERYRGIRAAMAELTAIQGDSLVATPQEAHEGFSPPDPLRATSDAHRRAALVKELSGINVKQYQAALERSTGANIGEPGPEVWGRASVMLTDKLLSVSPVAVGSPAFRPLGLAETGARLTDLAVRSLSNATSAVLREWDLAPSETSLVQMVDGLRRELTRTARELDSAYETPAQTSVKRIGDTLVRIKAQVPSAWASVAIGGGAGVAALPVPSDQHVPATHGEVAPAGVADLLIIKQQLLRYEGAEVAHIENVMKGESKHREHTRRNETEQLTFRETELTKTEERELESTDRFEMSRETNTTIKEDASLKAGLTLSGKYGPTVDFSASAEGSLARSKEEATKTAANFSKDVTQRSATKITERVLERASLRITSEVTEKNTHGLDNVAGSGHISGVYQCVNKVYEAQMFNYGIRAIFDFMIPEPGAFLAEALKTARANAIDIEKPPDFTLKPSDIQESNYGYWVSVYHATDVAPPPEVYKTKSLDFKAGGGDDETHYNHSAQIVIDEGYRAIQGSVGRVVNTWEDSDLVDVILGRRKHRFRHESRWIWVVSLSDETDSIPFAMDTFNVSHVALAVEVLCQRTERAMQKWQAETHAKLTTAYQARLAEYEEKIAAIEAQAGIPIRGKNPAANLELMKDELKKNCISIMTEQHFDLFNAVETSWSNGLPQIDLIEAKAEGAYVRFFEQAFEWEHMTWLTYPYFWGRKSQWEERLAFEDPDPMFNQFLKAGFCRVNVPARPGFEGAIDHFMTYGELWNGGPLPPISSPLYLPIADELAERLDRPGDEIPQGEPWLVRIPTTLVKLRADDTLPSWTQDASGEWVEA